MLWGKSRAPKPSRFIFAICEDNSSAVLPAARIVPYTRQANEIKFE
jgi:hypothetical protein